MSKPRKTMKQHKAARTQWSKDNQTLLVRLLKMCLEQPTSIVADIINAPWCPSEKQVALMVRLVEEFEKKQAEGPQGDFLPVPVGQRVTLQVTVAKTMKSTDRHRFDTGKPSPRSGSGYGSWNGPVERAKWTLLHFEVAPEGSGDERFTVCAFVSGELADLDKGASLTIRGTVKRHQNFGGIRKTMLTRVAIVKPKKNR